MLATQKANNEALNENWYSKTRNYKIREKSILSSENIANKILDKIGKVTDKQNPVCLDP
jgi:hypothetical protein